MNSGSLYAFYGSLRRGMENHKIFEFALHYQYSVRLTRFKMFALESFPFVTRTASDQDTIVAEVYRVTDTNAEQNIHNLEISLGYFYDEVVINGVSVGIYVYKNAENYPEVLGGDWVKFFGVR